LRIVPVVARTHSVLMIGMDMADGDDAYVFDEATGEWRPAGDVAAAASIDRGFVRDSAGTVLADGDSVTLIKDLKVKGANQTLKQGTTTKRSTAGTTRSRGWCCGRSLCVSADVALDCPGGRFEGDALIRVSKAAL
jgi:alkylphosphonate utilization operon protein PhnA